MNDDRMLNRHLDGELTGDLSEQFNRRLLQEPRLQARLRDLQALRGMFAAAPAVTAPAGFTADVVAAMRQERASGLRPDGDETIVVRFCRRLVIAAAVVVAAALLWQSGLFGISGRPELQASPAELEREVQQLDELIRSGRVPPPGLGR